MLVSDDVPALRLQGAALVAARAEVEERDYNRLLRAEQDRELQESLAADRAREEARALERERLEREASEAAAAQAAQAAAEEAARKAAREAAEAVQRRRAEKAASLGAEPDPGEGITQVRVGLHRSLRTMRIVFTKGNGTPNVMTINSPCFSWWITISGDTVARVPWLTRAALTHLYLIWCSGL